MYRASHTLINSKSLNIHHQPQCVVYGPSLPLLLPKTHSTVSITCTTLVTRGY